MNELMKIVKETCDDKGIDYDEVKDQYLQMMTFLHDFI